MRSLARKPVLFLSTVRWREWSRSKLVGYALAALGPISVSGAHFLLSFSMLHALDPAEFGRFTFLLVAAQLGWGVWSALFCSPLPIFMTRGVREDWEAGRDMLLWTNLLSAALMLAVFGAVALALGAPPVAGVLYAGFGALSLIRWFMRGYHYFENQQLKVVASDVLYGTSVVSVTALLHFGLGVGPERACFAGLLVGASAGLAPFARALWSGARAMPGFAFLSHYRQVWRDQSRWALLGAITTEATGNAHVYIVTLVLGPAAFAPLAAAALLLRPLGVVQLAFADFERPRLARLVSSRKVREIRRSLTQFQVALGLIWLATAGGAGLMFRYNEAGHFFPPKYDPHTLLVATILWLLVAAVRSLQVPPATILGVVGEFRRLALTSLCSSVVREVSVSIIVLALDPVWSIGGLLMGAITYTALTVGIYRQWLASRGADLTSPGAGGQA